MSLIGIEIGELRALHQQLLNGDISPKDCNLRLKIYKATAERERMILDMYKLSTLKGLSINKITQTGLFSQDELLPENATMFNEEFLHCPDLEKSITRDKCLDYSGESKNYDSCKSCTNFIKTRNKLL